MLMFQAQCASKVWHHFQDKVALFRIGPCLHSKVVEAEINLLMLCLFCLLSFERPVERLGTKPNVSFMHLWFFCLFWEISKGRIYIVDSSDLYMLQKCCKL